MAEPIFAPITTLDTRTVVLPQEDIDTDQIVPARFMTTTTRERLDEALFRDWRFDADDRPLPRHPLNRIDPAAHRVLVTGRNFGSGSSREHAPWALVDFGFRAVISSAVADIFAGNAVRNGLLVLAVPDTIHAALLAADGARVRIDLDRQILSAPDLGIDYRFAIDPFDRRCLLSGSDPLTWLVAQGEAIDRYEVAATVPLADLAALDRAETGRRAG